MKIAKRDIAIVMILCGAILAFCAFKFGYSPARTVVDAEKVKQANIQKEIDDIKKVAGTEPQMNSEMTAWAKEIEDALTKYNASYSYEDGILWMKQIEDAESSGKPVISTYTVNELGLYNMSSTVEGQGTFAGTSYVYGTTSYSFSYDVASYADLKSFINYIVTAATRDGVKTIDSMTFSVNAVSGSISGNVNMTVYVLTDAAGILNYKLPEVTNVNQSVTNIFGEPTGEEE